ncbi:OmpA family protein [Robiginitalea aurantiaca]|uniref:OmpA family protein n=1 Tax=Robiginitalea aurantiaca TaxID=3056915 RepID=A0ABT7WE36_9FLAO|nr:OmpA family protein [Robiginitalea aurantiaca]MDM9631168.1 OmpA family protein [Robiginitalea aurantiaca]
MKKALALLLFLLFLLLAWLAWGWYKDTVVCCPEEEMEVVVQYGPLIFDCSTGEVITNELWPDKKKEILNARITGKKLLLVAPYFGNEDPSAGVARAEKVKALFTELDPDDIVVGRRPVDDCESTMANMLHELQYKWVTRNDDVIELYDRTAILYKYDSDQEIVTPAVYAFSEEVSEYLKETGDRILLVGHTDSDGEEAYNLELGRERAEEYKAHLISLGVDESKIEIQSAGESDPAVPNDSPENKQRNRRVTVQIIK